MSGFTITGGVSFSGAVSMSPAPVENTAAWFGGGYAAPTYSRTSNVNRITYATDTATASVRGPLSGAKDDLAAAGNFTDGWFAGGRGPVGGSTVDRITYATDTATASVRGPLSSARYGMGAAGNTNYGWFAAGWSNYSTVDRITWATDTATASVRGPLSLGIAYIAAAGNDTDGWFGGGYVQSTTSDRSIVNRITYATDTATSSVRGPLSDARQRLAAAGNSAYGYFGGGSHAGFSAAYSIVDRITYATDTATASVRGPLSSARYFMGAASNTTDAWFAGGQTGGGTTLVDRITFATDTATASVRGPLSAATRKMAAAGGVQ